MPTRRTLIKIIRGTTREPVTVRLLHTVCLTILENILFAPLIIFISSSLKFMMTNNITDDIVRQLWYLQSHVKSFYKTYFQRTLLPIKEKRGPDNYPYPVSFLKDPFK